MAVVVAALVEVPINLWSSTAQAMPLALMILLSSRAQNSSSVVGHGPKSVRAISIYQRGKLNEDFSRGAVQRNWASSIGNHPDHWSTHPTPSYFFGA
jgi:hypothetical protein